MLRFATDDDCDAAQTAFAVGMFGYIDPLHAMGREAEDLFGGWINQRRARSIQTVGSRVLRLLVSILS